MVSPIVTRIPENLSPPVADEIKTTTCYMCACRCGIKVHLKDGRIRYIQGNPDHPVNRGVLCAKGSAGIMQQYSPARLTKPLRRVGERGSGEFEEIEWDEALSIATDWMSAIRRDDPKKLAFFTGRDQSQALTSWWAQQFGTLNYAAHGGFCSVNMAAAGMYTIGSAFWEFSEPDWERTRYFLLFGVAEDHGSNPIKIGLSKLKANGAKTVSINPIRTGYSAVADEWLGITPGMDGLLIFSLMHELLREGNIDVDYLLRYSDAPFLVIDSPGDDDHGLIARDDDGVPLGRERGSGLIVSVGANATELALKDECILPDGRRARPVFELLAERYLDSRYSPENVAEAVGVSAQTIERVARELAHAAFAEQIELDIPWTDAWGRHHEKTIGRPVAMHAMRGISAHSNGFHTCRAIHILQMLLGSIDVPGGLRFKPPYPRGLDDLPKPHGAPSAPGESMSGPHLGYPQAPADLLIDDDGKPNRIDKAFSWEAPLAAHGMMHTVIANAWAGDPYPIDTLFMYMANMAWNSSMNTAETIRMLTDRDESGDGYKIPRIIYSDAYYSETVAYADLILPDTTYLERWDAMSMLDRPISEPDAIADSIRQPVLEPDRDVRPFQDVLLDLGARLELPGMTTSDGSPLYPNGYKQYIVEHERKPGIGTLSGFRGVDGKQSCIGAVNKNQLEQYVANDCFWQHELEPTQRFYRHANADYLEFASAMGLRGSKDPVLLKLYSEPLQRFRLAAMGVGDIQPPEQHRERVKTFFDPLPIWYASVDEGDANQEKFTFNALTQRPMAMYHSWGGQNAWLRQIHGDNKLYIHEDKAAALGISDDDWVFVESAHSKIRVQAKTMQGVNPDTVWTWNAIGKRKGAWNLSPKASEANKGFLLNHLISDLLPSRDNGYRYANADPVTGQAAWYDLKVCIERDTDQAALVQPQFDEIKTPAGLAVRPKSLSYGKPKQ